MIEEKEKVRDMGTNTFSKDGLMVRKVIGHFLAASSSSSHEERRREKRKKRLNSIVYFPELTERRKSDCLWLYFQLETP